MEFVVLQGIWGEHLLAGNLVSEGQEGSGWGSYFGLGDHHALLGKEELVLALHLHLDQGPSCLGDPLVHLNPWALQVPLVQQVPFP